jgi:microcystin-dependent protein
MADIQKGYTFSNGETITPAKLHALVDDATVADGSITTAKLANSLVTTAKIADANVTTAKIADANITTAKIADGAVTQSKLNASVIFIPAGAVMPFAMNGAPAGWLAANGDAVSRSTYANLFAAISTTHGAGNGSTTFNLPDLRGIFVRGSGSQTISGTTYNKTFAAKEGDAYKSHNHGGTTGTGTTGIESQGHTHSGTTNGESQEHGHSVNSVITTGLNGSSANISLGGGGYRIDNPSTTFNGNDHTHSFTTGGISANHTHGVPSLSISADGGTETRPANIALLYCIKF